MLKFAGGGSGFVIPVMNMYESIRANLHFNKFVVEELLFVEYKWQTVENLKKPTGGRVWIPSP